MTVSERSARDFETAIEDCFSFLTANFGYVSASVRNIQGDPRDSYMLASFSNDKHEISFAWSEFELSLGVLLQFSRMDLERKKRAVYFEPFVEFVTNGVTLPITPQCYPRMSTEEIKALVTKREDVFQHGLHAVMKALASRLREYLPVLQTASTETVRRYHRWYAQ